MSNSLRPHGLYSPWNSPSQNPGVGSLSLLQGDLSNPGIKPRCPTLQVDSLPAEPQGKPKNTGLGSLFLVQGIFPIQESNQGLLHQRWIFYQQSYQGSPVSIQFSKFLYYIYNYKIKKLNLSDYYCHLLYKPTDDVKTKMKQSSFNQVRIVTSWPDFFGNKCLIGLKSFSGSTYS